MLTLVKKCVCGNDKSFSQLTRNKIPLLKCKRCDILHQEVWMTQQQYNDFYSKDYHDDYQSRIGCTPYETRYRHDVDVARMRLDKYKKYAGGGKLLDIGSSNGAFVDAARERGYEAWGLEPGVALSKNSDYIFNTCLEESCLPEEHLGSFKMITLHDVFEHLVDPFTGLKVIKQYLHPEGTLIIDFPDYYNDKGLHHWREVQHLWYFTEEQVLSMLGNHGLKVLETDKPIPGKLVFYARKKRLLSAVEYAEPGVYG